MRYSDKEVELFQSFKSEEFDPELVMDTSPFHAYNTLFAHCFRQNLTGPNVESARRCALAWAKGKLNRMTPEWDSLIHLKIGQATIYFFYESRPRPTHWRFELYYHDYNEEVAQARLVGNLPLENSSEPVLTRKAMIGDLTKMFEVKYPRYIELYDITYKLLDTAKQEAAHA